MAIRIRCEVDGFIFNEAAKIAAASEPLVVATDAESPTRVVLEWCGRLIMVEADDLILAIENAVSSCQTK